MKRLCVNRLCMKSPGDDVWIRGMDEGVDGVTAWCRGRPFDLRLGSLHKLFDAVHG